LFTSHNEFTQLDCANELKFRGYTVRVLSPFFLSALVITGSIGMQAGTITFASVGTAADPNQYQSLGNSLVIAQHPGWAAPLPGSSWVSYGDTGDPAGPTYFMPANGTIVSFFQLLSIPGAPSAGSVTFRADDSSALYVNGTLVVPEATGVNNNYTVCSDYPVGCLVQTEVTANITPYLIGGQTNVLRFDVAQRNSISFGLNYSGSASWNETTETPEPATLLMMGAGFALLGVIRKRRSA